MPTTNPEGKRRRGQLNGTQSQILSIYGSAIMGIVAENPGLNISEISRMLPKKREQVLRSLTISPQLQRKLPRPGRGDLRKTVRKHLTRMLAHGQVRLISGRYYPREPSESKELIRSVDQTLSSVEPQNWSFPMAEDVAVYRTYVAPASNRFRFDAFFADHGSEFKNSLFFLQRILEDAIGSGHLSTKFYDLATNSLNMRLLREGWNAHFADTKLLIWAFAINQSKFLEFIETPSGKQWVMELLAANGERILARGRKRLVETRAMARKLKKIQAVIAKEAFESPDIVNIHR